MKIIEEKKVIEQIINTYVSEDGKEFKTEKECKAHEKSLLMKEINEKINLIKQVNYTPPLTDSDYNYMWFYLENQEDANIVKEYYKSIGHYNDSLEIEVEAFPCWYGIEEGYDNDAWSLGTLENYRQDVEGMLEEFKKN